MNHGFYIWPSPTVKLINAVVEGEEIDEAKGLGPSRGSGVGELSFGYKM